MQQIKRELTKEEYDELNALPHEKQEQRLNIPISWTLGYGYYGHILIEKDGKYYAVFTIGDSCD